MLEYVNNVLKGVEQIDVSLLIVFWYVFLSGKEVIGSQLDCQEFGVLQSLWKYAKYEIITHDICLSGNKLKYVPVVCSLPLGYYMTIAV